MSEILESTVTFEDVKPAIGSIVRVARDRLLTAETARACLEALEHRTVLVFPEVNLTDEEQLAFTDLLGARQNITSFATSDQPKEEDVYKVTLDKKVNRQPEYVLGTFFWHMDGITIDAPPAFATLLSCRKTASAGGDTEFASTYAAYNGLPECEKQALEGLKAMHSVKASLREILDAIPEEDYDRVVNIGLLKEHPIVWTHENGRKSMVIGTTADHVVGQPIPHGRSLLVRLQEWAAQPDYSYRHKWEEGDFVIWNNTGAMHRVVPYDAESGRMMHRTSLGGHEPVTA